MTNYVIEEGIDFFTEIARGALDETDEHSTCLLTGEPLEFNHIVMQCGHKFNYIPLYHEVMHQKSQKHAFANDTIRLSVNQMKCPYCRFINSKLLPYVPLPGFTTKVKGVNSPSGFCMPGKTCTWVFKTGKRKGHVCGCPAYEDATGVACTLHRRIKRTVLPVKDCDVKNCDVTKHDAKSLHKMKVVELRDILRTKNLRLGGRKSELIDRILAFCK